MYKSKDVLDFMEHKFDFAHQTKTDFTDWTKAFENAVRKRAVDNCFIGLSSGYDSGAVANEMLKLGIKFKIYSVKNNENQDVLNKRLEYLQLNGIEVSVVDEVPRDDYKRLYSFLDGKINNLAMKDIASPGVAYMFESARKESKSVCICPQGGDETISDYALFPEQSTFKGVWPEELFEWENFKSGKNEEYIREIEDIAGLYDVECRFPFLDIDLVQEYLWLSPKLKNSEYKAPLAHYLTTNGFPFDRGKKKGFRPIEVNKI
jgi:asparagine synthetase B (glutamine-hydrolysing)